MERLLQRRAEEVVLLAEYTGGRKDVRRDEYVEETLEFTLSEF